MERIESQLEYFLRTARAAGISKGVLVGKGFVSHWQGSKEDSKCVDPRDGTVFDRFEDAPAVALYYPSVERILEDTPEKYVSQLLGFQLNCRVDKELIHVHGSTKPYDRQTAAAKDPFALFAQGKIVPDSYFWNFWRTEMKTQPELQRDECCLSIKTKDDKVVRAYGDGLLEETARTIRSVIGDKISVDYRPILDWMLSAYVGRELPKLSYEDIITQK